MSSPRHSTWARRRGWTRCTKRWRKSCRYGHDWDESSGLPSRSWVDAIVEHRCEDVDLSVRYCNLDAEQQLRSSLTCGLSGRGQRGHVPWAPSCGGHGNRSHRLIAWPDPFARTQKALTAECKVADSTLYLHRSTLSIVALVPFLWLHWCHY